MIKLALAIAFLAVFGGGMYVGIIYLFKLLNIDINKKEDNKKSEVKVTIKQDNQIKE